MRWDEGQFDAAFSVLGVMFLGPQVPTVLAAMRRAVRPGGVVAVVHWATPWGAPYFDILAQASRDLDDPDIGTLEALLPGDLSREALQEALLMAGLVDVHAEPLDAAGAIPTSESFLTELKTFFAGVPGFGDLTVGQRERLKTAIVDTIRPIEEGNAPRPGFHANLASGTCPPRTNCEISVRLPGSQHPDDEYLHTLLCWRSEWMSWHTTHWSEIDAAALRSRAYKILNGVDYEHPIREKGVVVDHEVRPWCPDKRKIANVIEAMAAIGHVPSDIDPPSWIGPQFLHSAAESSTPQIISCTNGLLDLSTWMLTKHTPELFNLVSVPFDYDRNAPKPEAWLAFLASLWTDDPDSIALLQEYMGYVLSARAAV